MRDIPTSASWRAGVFTMAEATATGWTVSALRHAVRQEVLVRLRPGVYAVPPAASPSRRLDLLTQRAVAAALVNHGVRVSHLAAGRVSGFDVWAEAPRACVTHSGAAVSAIPHVHPHRLEVTAEERATLGDLLITSPARTVVDIAREFGVEAGVVAADAALRTPFGNRERLVRAVGLARGRPHVDRAREALVLADPRSESVLESRSRFRMSGAGLPAPLTQVDISDLSGTRFGRVDFYWPDFGVVGEADGLGKYEQDGAVTREKLREDALRDLGLEVVRWGWRDLWAFAPTVHKIHRGFARGESVLSRRRWRATQRPLDQLPPRLVV